MQRTGKRGCDDLIQRFWPTGWWKKSLRREKTRQLGVCVCGSMAICLVALASVHAKPLELKRYVKKYAELDLSSRQKVLAQNHEYLIQYFSSQSYFKQGYTVNPNFIRALMLAESGADQFALSSKNAIGLCQLLYPTAVQAAKEILRKDVKLRYVSPERLRTLQPVDLFDPAVNILLTCFLIAKYNQVYDGRLDLVVAAWNAGQGSIRNGQPPQYHETLNLIGKVNGLLIALNRNDTIDE